MAQNTIHVCMNCVCCSTATSKHHVVHAAKLKQPHFTDSTWRRTNLRLLAAKIWLVCAVLELWLLSQVTNRTGNTRYWQRDSHTASACVMADYGGVMCLQYCWPYVVATRQLSKVCLSVLSEIKGRVNFSWCSETCTHTSATKCHVD